MSYLKKIRLKTKLANAGGLTSTLPTFIISHAQKRWTKGNWKNIFQFLNHRFNIISKKINISIKVDMYFSTYNVILDQFEDIIFFEGYFLYVRKAK